MIKPKVLYIFSNGHSGSTILDKYLGGFEPLFSAGEMKYFPWQVFRDGKMCELHQDICTCGKPFTECIIYSKVIKELEENECPEIVINPLKFRIGYTYGYKHIEKNLIRKVWSRIVLRSLLNKNLFLFNGLEVSR